MVRTADLVVYVSYDIGRPKNHTKIKHYYWAKNKAGRPSKADRLTWLAN
jgi:hypothetical protein